jgi:hypothetical protein
MTSQGPIELYRSWKRTYADIGCVFARLMATKPPPGYAEAVVAGSDPSTIGREVATRIAAFVDDPEIFAAALVLPDVNDLPTLTKMALALASEPLWTITRWIISGTPIGDVVAFNLVREIPKADGGTCLSESLALAPFSEFPKTRRAPVTALEIFVGTAPAHQPTGDPTVKAHLADFNIEGLPAPSIYQLMWDGSKTGRLKSLGGVDDLRAKAKVTFAIPVSVASLIGCMP